MIVAKSSQTQRGAKLKTVINRKQTVKKKKKQEKYVNSAVHS